MVVTFKLGMHQQEVKLVCTWFLETEEVGMHVYVFTPKGIYNYLLEMWNKFLISCETS